MARLFLAVDVGATRTRVAVVAEGGEIVARGERLTPRRGTRRTIAEAILELARDVAGQLLERVHAVGVGTVGPLDLHRGRVVGAPNIPIHEFDLAEPLIEELGKPVIIANDCVAAAWGEHLYGAGRGVDNLVYITISTGIGGGMIVDGLLLLGKNGNAHEIGHITVDIQGRMPCNCGGRGHWEAYASGANIPRFARYLVEEEWKLTQEEKATETYKLIIEDKLTAKDLYQLARKGDQLAKRIVDEVNKYNLAGLEAVVNLYDPQLVTIGGSVALNNPDLVIEPLAEALKRHPGLVTSLPEVKPTPLGDDAVLLGAAALAEKPPKNLLAKLDYLPHKQ